MTARQKDILGWVAVLLLGVGAYVVTRPKTDSDGRIDRPGVNTDSGVPTARVSFGAKLDKGQDGSVVLEVFAGSNAERAGVRVGDTIVKVNGKPCPEPKVFTTALAATSPGGVLELELRRADGTVAPVRVTIYPESGFEGDLAARLIGEGWPSSCRCGARTACGPTTRTRRARAWASRRSSAGPWRGSSATSTRPAPRRWPALAGRSSARRVRTAA